MLWSWWHDLDNGAAAVGDHHGLARSGLKSSFWKLPGR